MFGSAFSSPVLSTIEGVDQFVVQTRTKLAGIEFSSGRVLWSVEVPAFRGMNIVTPTIHGSSIFTSSYGGGSFRFDIEKRNKEWKVTQRWKNNIQGYMSSPLMIHGHIYLHLRNQRLTCIDFETGKQRWSSTPFGKYWSTVQKENRVLALDQRGELLLLDPNPEKFTLVDRRKVAEDSWAHVAIADDLILVRDLNSLMVYRWS